jgi:hypothetical protein
VRGRARMQENSRRVAVGGNTSCGQSVGGRLRKRTRAERVQITEAIVEREGGWLGG